MVQNVQNYDVFAKNKQTNKQTNKNKTNKKVFKNHF